MHDLAYSNVLRSLGTAAILVLNGLDPEADYLDMTSIRNTETGRLSVTDTGQKLDMIYGGDGLYSPSGVIIEGFAVRDYKGRKRFRTIISISRLFKVVSFESEQARLSDLCQRGLKNFIYKTRSAPVYAFNPNNVNATAIIGNVIWPSDAIGDEPIQERLAGDMSAGGSVRIEYEFQAYYTTIFA